MYVSIKLVVRFYHLRSFMDVYVCFIPYSIHRNVTTLRLKCLNLVGAAPRQRKHTNYVHDDKCFPQNWESEQLNDFWNIHPTEIRINWTTFVLDYIDHNRIIRPSIDYIYILKCQDCETFETGVILWWIWNDNSTTHTKIRIRKKRTSWQILIVKDQRLSLFSMFCHSSFIVHWFQTLIFCGSEAFFL